MNINHGLLRYILALFVVTSHTYFLVDKNSFLLDFQLGNPAVACFFILSGFLMNYSLENIYKERVFDFYKNRFLRIFPQLIFAMITTLIVHCFVSEYITGNSINIGQEFKGFKSFTFENIAYCMFETFIPLWEFIYNPVTKYAFNLNDLSYVFLPYLWAIKVELLFYIMIGMIYFSKSIIKFEICGNILSIILFILTIIGTLSYQYDGYWFISAFQWSCYFYLGAIFISSNNFKKYSLISIVSGHFYIYTNSHNELNFKPLFLFIFLIGITYILLSGRIKFSHKGQKIDNFLGSLSYPIYINHFSICILYYSILQFNQLVINNSIFICSLFIITLFSIFTILIVERNISKMRSRVRKVKL